MGLSPAIHSSARHDWATPQALFNRLHERFGFTLDAAASPDNAKCARFYTVEDDGLSQPWEGVVWLNSPYGRELPLWISKARRSAEAGATVVCLVPARTDTRWWHDLVLRPSGELRFSYYEPHRTTLTIGSTGLLTEVQFLRGRLKFGAAKSGAPFPSAVVAFIGGAR